MLLSEGCIKRMGNADKYSRVFLNALFQMEKLETEMDINISNRLKPIKASLVFIELYNSKFKSERIE